MTPEKWLNDLLEKRGLTQPDGRMLYEYRLSNEEYSSLHETIKFALDFGRLDEVAKRIRRFSALFVMYASEWWRRDYDGGAWRWTPIIQSFGGDPNALPTNVRTDCVVLGFAYWGHRPNGVGKKFFGSVVAQGGLPLKFIAHGRGKLTSIMEHSIRLASRYRWDNSQLIDSIAERSNELPDSLRRHEIFELIASMVTSILEIKQEFGLSGVADPLAVLNNNDPVWRQRFPLPLDDQAAQALLTGLVKEAARQSSNSQLAIFTVERFLKTVGDRRYQLVSSLLCPQTVDADALATLFSLPSAESLPRYFNLDLKLQSREPFADGRQLLGSQIAKVSLSPRKRIWSGLEACAENSLILCGPNGDLRENPLSLPGGGELLCDEPWVFVFRDGQYKLAACGSARVPEDEALITLPNGWQIELAQDASSVDEGHCEINGCEIPLFRVQGDISIINDNLKYRIRTRQATNAIEVYVWEGRKFHYPSTPSSIYIGTPKLYRYSADGERARISSSDMKWFIAGSRTPVDDPSSSRGPMDVVLFRDGENIARFRLVVIDSAAQTKFVSGPTSATGNILLDGWGNSDISVQPLSGLTTQVLASPNGYELLLDGGLIPPESITLELHWPKCLRDVRLKLPFPCSGGRFFDGTGGSLRDREVLPLKHIMGAKMRVFDRNPQQPKRYEIAMTLKGTSLKEKKPVSLGKDGSAEIRLIDLQPHIEILMGFSDSLDAVVEVALNANDSCVCSIQISRYEFHLVHLPPGRIGLPTKAIERLDTDRLSGIRMLAKPITSLDHDVIEMVQVCSEGVHTGVWRLDELDPRASPWLIYPDESSSVYFRPTAWVSFAEHGEEAQALTGKCPLAQAMMASVTEERERQISDVLTCMAKDFSHDSWNLIDHLWKSFHHLPLSSLDVFRDLGGKPEVLVALMLRSQLSVDDLLELTRRLRDELGLVWELTTIPMWEAAVKSFWSYWKKILGIDAAQASFPIVLSDRFDALSSNVPSLKLMLDFVQYEVINRKTDELSILWEQSDKDSLAAARQLWSGSESLGNTLLFVAHAQDANWPAEKTFFESAWKGFVKSSDMKTQGVIEPIAKYLFWIRPSDFKLAVANAPVLCALWAVTGVDQAWWNDSKHRLALRKLRAFDPIWFEQAFRQAVAACLSLDKLIYPKQLITFDGAQ